MTEKKIISQIEGTQFQADLTTPLMVNDNNFGKGLYNLIISIRDVSLFIKGIKPHRFWRLKDVKAYYGLVGGKEKCLEQLKAYKEFLVEEK